MKSFHLIANSIKDPDGIYTRQIKDVLIKLGADNVSEGDDIPADTDAILVLGGDGTMLRAAGDNIGSDIPLLGVNLGTIGYLAEADMNQIEDDLSILFGDHVMVEDRMMLSGAIYLSGMDDNSCIVDHCLNDVSVTGSGALSLIRYDLYVNGEYLSNYAADGIVISTPTGSTGYNMSAGGPIVEPKANLIVVTPICPHTLNTRSIVLSADDEIMVRISDQQKDKVAVLFDGRPAYMLGSGEFIRINKSKHVTRIIKLRRESFLNNLQKKLV